MGVMFMYPKGEIAQPIKVAILGSTGSIGTQTLDVISSHPDKFKVVALAAGSNRKLLEEQIERFKPQMYCLVSDKLPGGLSGPEGMLEIAASPQVDLLVVATTGSAGWEPTIEGIRNGKIIALANKEALVMAGRIIVSEAHKHDAIVRPIDSEHSAIWQCLQGEGLGDSKLRRPEGVKRIILTASGGPFRDTPLEEMKQVTPSQALAHPNWRMGNKVTIDSATLMNKGLEVIEAHWLFDMPFEQLDVVIHPQSIVHSMVEFNDGSIKAQLGIPDMRVPIQYALCYPEHSYNSKLGYLDFTKSLELQFYPPDMARFPCLHLAIEAGKKGSTYPAVLSAADDEAVAAFLEGHIGFLDISCIVEEALAKHEAICKDEDIDLESIRQADRWARLFVKSFIKSMKGRSRIEV